MTITRPDATPWPLAVHVHDLSKPDISALVKERTFAPGIDLPSDDLRLDNRAGGSA